MLKVSGLSAGYDGLTVVHGVNLSVEPGSLTVLVGANGAGKTTLMDLISGRTPSTEGRVFLFDQDITNKEEFAIARAGLGRKFQIPSVFKELSVRRNLEVASCPSRGVFSNLRFGFPKPSRVRVDEALELVALKDVEHELAANLSHGQTQWLELGLLIVQEPKVLLLDEPTAGMTAAETQKTARIINELKGRHTLVVVEHDMAFVREIAERITVLHLGQIIAEGDIAKIETDPKVKEAYLGSGGIH